MKSTRRTIVVTAFAVASMFWPLAQTAHATSAQQLSLDGRRALDKLYLTEPRARLFSRRAKTVLVFTSIIKGGLVFGAETGTGVLPARGRPEGYYNISSVSWGLQAGGQLFSYAPFFMKERVLAYLHKSGGWTIGAAPRALFGEVGIGSP